MIVPMKKVAVITTSSDIESTLEELRNVGVVHVETDGAQAQRLENLLEQESRLQRALNALPETDSKATVVPDETAEGDVDAALRAAQQIETKTQEIDQTREAKDKLQRELDRVAPWGDFDPGLFHTLDENGVHVGLYQLPPDDLKNFECSWQFEIERSKTLVRILAVELDANKLPEDPAPIPLPSRSLSDIRTELDAREHKLNRLLDELKALAGEKPVIERGKQVLGEDIGFARVRSSVGSDDDLSWLTGYVPVDAEQELRDAARQHRWGLSVQEPGPEDPVPTKVHNPKPIRIIQPVFNMLGTIPGYRELDISFWFLMFFTVFFAMIIGDGGYGLILLVGSLWGAIKTRRAGKPMGPGLVLLTVLSISTIIWGAITGNWFGYQPISNLPLLRNLVVPELNAFSDVSVVTVQWFCFILGAVQLSIAHIWNFIRGMRDKNTAFLAAVSELGMLSLVSGLYFLVLQLVLALPGYVLPEFALYMIIGGFSAVLLFSRQEKGKNILVGIAKGLANIITIALDSIGAFSDIISYIRLYAVGLASLAIAQSFNEMAAGIAGPDGGLVGIVAMVFILLLGHTLNLAMGALSVIVHGVRLNMLEFSGHLGMEWTGASYAPFRKRETA